MTKAKVPCPFKVGDENSPPATGSFIAWKKVRALHNGRGVFAIVKLEVPEDAMRTRGWKAYTDICYSDTGNLKCRASSAKVLSITTIRSKRKIKEARSDFKPDFLYEVGKVVHAKKYNQSRSAICTRGIHFFMKRSDAVNYKF
jgi:hypothetical protein